MDDYEAMMARALERREALKVRLKQTVIVSPTKRHVDSLVETENVSPPTLVSDEDSPSKRCCTDQAELAALRETGQDNAVKSSPCQAKLAALARDINSWEDAASHPAPKKADSIKKMWKPSSERSKLSSFASTHQNTSVKCEKQFGVSEIRAFGNSRTNDLRGVSKPVDANQKVASSSLDNIQTVSSVKAVAKTVGGVGTAVARKRSVALSTADVKQKNNNSTVDLVKSSVSAAVAVQRVPTVSNEIGEINCLQSNEYISEETPNRRLSDVNEPTRQPVSARMAAWKKKSACIEENAKAKPVGNTKKTGLSTIVEKKPMVDKAGVDHSRTATRLQQSRLNIKTSSSASKLLRNSAVGNTGHQTTPSCDSKSHYIPLKDEETSLQALSKSEVVETVPLAKPSPKKLGLATIGIQEKLSAMCESWKKNEIAEKSRQERAADIALLESRWKNGILVENDTNAPPSCAIPQNTCVSSSGAIPPPPPPPPPPPLPYAWPQSKTVTESGQSSQCRSKTVETASSSNIRTSESECKKLSTQVASILETNLLAMGFARNGEGAVAILPRQVEGHHIVNSARPAESIVDTNQASEPSSMTPTVARRLTDNKETINGIDMTDAACTQGTSLGGLYGLVKDHIQVMRNSSSNIPGNGELAGSKNTPSTKCVERTPTVYFCESKNTVRVASSAEESFCSDEDQFAPDNDCGNATSEESSCYDEEGTITSYDDPERETDSVCDVASYANNGDSDLEDHSSDSPQQIVDRPNNRDINRHYSYRHRQPLKMGIGGRPTAAAAAASLCESDSELSSSSLDDSISAVGEVSTTATQSYKKSLATPRNRSVSVSNGPGDVMHHSAQSARKPLQHKELSCDVAEYRHAATLPNHLDCHSHHSYTSSPRSRRSPHNSVQPQDQLVRQHAGTFSKKSISSQIQGLKEMAAEEESVLLQASNALSHCIKSANHSRSTASSFVGSTEAVECHRLLLVALKKRESLLTEVKRLREGQGNCSLSNSLGSLVLSNIRVPIKPDFIAKIGSIHDSSIHHFVLLLRNGVNMMASRRFSTQESLVHGCIDVPGEVRLNCVPCDFSPSVCLEVYSMVVSRDQSVSLTPKKLSRKVKDEDSRIRGTSFVLVAQLYLNMDSLNKTHFPLNGVSFSCPLQGTIHAKVTLIPEVNTFFRGFLSVYGDDSRSVFSRYWCVLYNDRILMWNNRTAELYKEAIRQIDLRQCITQRVIAGCFGSSTCPTCIELVVVRKAVNVQSQTKHHSENISTARFWLIADSPQECAIWCARLNRVLDDLREWHPYAVPSVRLPPPAAADDKQHSSK